MTERAIFVSRKGAYSALTRIVVHLRFEKPEDFRVYMARRRGEVIGWQADIKLNSVWSRVTERMVNDATPINGPHIPAH